MDHSTKKRVSAATLLVAIGIVFGDIGTSPLYVFQTITGGSNFSAPLIMGGLSAVFWTLLLLATIKYIYIFTLLACLSVCFYPINTKTPEPIESKFFVEPPVTPRFKNDQNLKNLC